MSETLLDQLEVTALQALSYNENAEVAPVALLWPDRDRQFTPAAERLRGRLPVLTLGTWDGSGRQGPANWLRCAIAGTIKANVTDGIPIVYLPGVGREDLRAIENCPWALAPIAELQYRGEWFAHPNGKDWTVRAFLSNQERGLGLAIADDATTADALLGAFAQVLDLPMRQLAVEYIDASFLHGLLNPDPIEALLSWLDDPTGYRGRVDDERWKAFVQQSKKTYGFDPSKEGEVLGGRRLGERQGAWQQVWERFEQNPERYRSVEERLRKGKPTDQLFAGAPDSWPQDNEVAESNLRSALSDLEGTPDGEARDVIERLWDRHRERRAWVWAQLGEAPLVFALEQLHRLAQLTAGGPSGEVQQLVAGYAEGGWHADDAFLLAMAAASDPNDRAAVAVAATALYRPWLESHALALQKGVGPMVNAGTYAPGPEASTSDGTVTVFVDGLRLDLAHRLTSRLGGLDTVVDSTLAALPTVTANAKAALAPVPEGALSAGDDLAPVRTGSRVKANVNVLRSLMVERGVQVLQGADTGDPSGCAWTEAGEIDGRGHQFGVAMVDDLDSELDRIAKRIKLLLDAGWDQVDVVTDHGWLLLPGGLAKVDLPPATTVVKKGRCARLKDGAHVSVPTVPWHWDPDVRIALAPGITCFVENQEYEHGGVSLQECVVPRLRVAAGAARRVTGGPTITKIKWLGLMCRIEFEHVPPGATIDIRALSGDPSTSVAEDAKETAGGGKRSLFVPDEEVEGEKAYVVIVGTDGEILAQRDVTIGSNR